MTPRRVWIVGAGKRVRETALPALAAAGDAFEVLGIFGRSARNETLAGKSREIRPLASLVASDLSRADLVYLAVGKQSVPEVLATLARFELGNVDLLIDTPVLLLKHFRHSARFRLFRNAWVAEDCAFLPWFDVVRAEFAGGALGPLREARLMHAAYAYHAFATLKALFGVERIAGARRVRDGNGSRRLVRIDAERSALIAEPRDYSKGWIELVCARGAIIEGRSGASGSLSLDPIVESGACVGFRVGERTLRLAAREIELMSGPAPTLGVTARMEAMKRVGFLRLLESIAAGRGAHPLASGLDDMLVDYWLEKTGRWSANSLTSIDSALARGLYGTLSRVVGR
ncbi:MAG: hypothetical protein K8S98_11600 [Planctomycetes bacterium]|nr:hypothetical protein [Planctomycetota bacterium]